MKLTILFLVICLPCTTKLHAQSINDSSVYYAGLSLLENSKTRDNFLEAANYFEQLDVKSKGQWLASYYAGLCYVRASYHVKEGNEKDGLMDKAQPLIDRALRLKPNEPEIYILQAFLFQSRLQVNPMMRGLSYSQKADASLKKAMAADPANPRTFTLLGYNLYYTPEMFGGGAKKALPLFIQAKTKYLAFKPELPFMPDWGEKENQEMIIACSKAIN